jgi:hypothetical protein
LSEICWSFLNRRLTSRSRKAIGYSRTQPVWLDIGSDTGHGHDLA